MSGLREALERHVSHRCPRMAEHAESYRSGQYKDSDEALPVPCDDCYSVEVIWRRVPYESDSRTPADRDEVLTLAGMERRCVNADNRLLPPLEAAVIHQRDGRCAHTAVYVEKETP